ncbi:LysE family transporter, partial [Mycobacterium tuberculosis]
MMTLKVAIGPQNAFVLRQGIRREYVLVIVALCGIADGALIAAGVGGFAALIHAHPNKDSLVALIWRRSEAAHEKTRKVFHDKCENCGSGFGILRPVKHLYLITERGT